MSILLVGEIVLQTNCPFHQTLKYGWEILHVLNGCSI